MKFWKNERAETAPALTLLPTRGTGIAYEGRLECAPDQQPPIGSSSRTAAVAFFRRGSRPLRPMDQKAPEAVCGGHRGRTGYR